MICVQVLNESHLTNYRCGQHFVKCASSSGFSFIRYLPLKCKIDMLEVYCSNREEGCQMTMQLGELNSHEGVCGCTKVRCGQSCEVIIFRKDILQHCNSDCPKQIIKCKHCGKEDHAL